MLIRRCVIDSIYTEAIKHIEQDFIALVHDSEAG